MGDDCWSLEGIIFGDILPPPEYQLNVIHPGDPDKSREITPWWARGPVMLFKMAMEGKQLPSSTEAVPRDTHNRVYWRDVAMDIIIWVPCCWLCVKTSFLRRPSIAIDGLCDNHLLELAIQLRKRIVRRMVQHARKLLWEYAQESDHYITAPRYAAAWRFENDLDIVE